MDVSTRSYDVASTSTNQPETSNSSPAQNVTHALAFRAPVSAHPALNYNIPSSIAGEILGKPDAHLRTVVGKPGIKDRLQSPAHPEIPKFKRFLIRFGETPPPPKEILSARDGQFRVYDGQTKRGASLALLIEVDSSGREIADIQSLTRPELQAISSADQDLGYSPPTNEAETITAATDSNGRSTAAEKMNKLRQAVNQTQSQLLNALQRNDPVAALAALKRHADPYVSMHGLNLAPDMAELLTQARTIRQLYRSDKNYDDKLDRLIQRFDLAAARSMLKEICGSAHPADTWVRAVQRKDLAVQRAMLVLLPKEVDTIAKTYRSNKPPISEFNVDEVKGVDSNLDDFLKSVPYLSRKRSPLECTNDEETLACAPLAFLFTSELRDLETGKHDYSRINLKNREANFSAPTVQQQYKAAIRNAAQAYPVDHDRLGALFADILATLAPGQFKCLLLESTNHSMGVELKAKRNIEKNRTEYVVKFYDPNFTNTHMRARVPHPEDARKWSLASFMVKATILKQYYPNRAPQSMAFVLGDGQHPPGSSVQRRTVSGMEYTGDPYSPCALHHYMRNGYDESLAGLPDLIKNLPAQEAFSLLNFPGHRGGTGAYFAFQYGFDEVIKRLCEAMAHSQLSPWQKFETIMASEYSGGTPGLYMSFQNGHAAAIRALLDYLPESGIPKRKHKDMVMCRKANRTPGPYMAYVNGHADPIQALLSYLPKIDVQDHMEILACIRRDGRTALYESFQAGHATPIEALMEFLAQSDVPPTQVKEILLCRDPDGTPGPFAAYLLGRGASIQALLKGLPQCRLSPSQVVEVIYADRASDKTPGLLVAVLNGHTELIGIFHEGLKKSGLTESEQNSVLRRILDAHHGETQGSLLTAALTYASRQGNYQTIKALLNILPASEAFNRYRIEIMQYESAPPVSEI